MTIDTRDLPLILETVKAHNRAYKKNMNDFLLTLATRKDKPSVALKTRIMTANTLFDKLERALIFIEDGLEDYE